MIDLEKRDIQDILDDMVDGFLNSTSATNEEYAQAQSLVSQAFCLGIDRKQAEITELKQKLEKIESGEFVLVPRDKIEVFWQDDDELENFCSLESNLECLGDGIDLNEIMTINKHHTAHIETEKMYGTWFAEFGHPKEKANFHVGTHQECLDIVAKNKAMIEAVEKGHD